MTDLKELRLGLDPVAFWIEAGLGEPQPWQLAALRSEAKQALFNCARQSGKSTVAACLAVHTACYTPGSTVLMVSRTLDHSGELFRRALAIYRSVGRPVPALNETQLSLALENGSRIISRPGSSDTSARGYTSNLLVIDEASRVPDELYYSATPVLAKTGGRTLALSTPFGERGWWYEAWRAEHEPWERYQITGWELPHDWYKPSTPKFLAAEQLRLGMWWFAQEYECRFMRTEDQVFSHEVVDRALTDEVAPLF